MFIVESSKEEQADNSLLLTDAELLGCELQKQVAEYLEEKGKEYENVD